LINCEITDNKANISPRIENIGGGGISARNARLVKMKKTLVADNLVEGSGGGLYFITLDAGSAGSAIFDFDFNDFLWDENVYNYTRAFLNIDQKSSFVRNRATKNINQNDVPENGGGGAIYVRRFKSVRASNIPIPGQELVTPPVLEGTFIKVFIGSTDVISPSNSASFPHSDRLFLEDRVVTTNGIMLDDRNLNPTGARFTFP
jgi:hypothetical protein